MVVVPGSLQAWLRGAWEEYLLPRALRAAGVDVLFSPYGAVPRRSPIPVVAMIHDLHFMGDPSAVPWGHRRYWNAVARRAPLAARVLTPSESVRRDAIERLGLQPERVVVTPHGVAAPFESTRERPAAEPFILAFGPWIPRKNLDLLVEATRGLRDEAGRPMTLLVTGRRPAAGGPGDSVSSTGPISDAALADLMRRSTLCCIPSLYEGFGLPALEAMACGSPLVVSAAGALPEVVGEAAVILSENDPPTWRKTLERLIADPGERTRLSRAGIERSRAFSWEATARLVGDTLIAAAVRFQS